MSLFLIYAAVAALAGSTKPDPTCAPPTVGAVTGAHFFIESVKSLPRDTGRTARLCVVPPKAGLGSYQATLAYDSTVMRAVRVDVTNGMQATNMSVPGLIKFAGAAPSGFARGLLATIVFKPSRGKPLGKIRLTLVEANSTKGATLLAGSRVAGYPATDRTLGVIDTKPAKPGTSAQRPSPSVATSVTPHIDSISPSSGKVDPESVVEVALYGWGFADGNVVLFDAATVERPVAENGGTILRFIVPTMIPAYAKVQTHRVDAGRFSVKVRSAAGTSNAVTFTVRGENR
jgi:hypothetical protein